MTDLVFLDTETVGLALDDDIWEIAARRRFADGRPDETFHAFVGHLGCEHLPAPFLADHLARWPSDDHGATPRRQPSLGGRAVQDALAEFLARDDAGQRPHLVGAVPDFDAYRLRLQGFTGNGEPPWHYHLVDVENLAVGWLNAREQAGPGRDRPPLEPPWDSEHLSFAMGVDPDAFPRHTAMGDVEWAMALYDRVMGR